MPNPAPNRIAVSLNAPLSAVQWFKHGDHPAVQRSNGSTWELFPEESDERHGLLCGVHHSTAIVTSGDWIVCSEVFGTYAIFKPEAFEKHFSRLEAPASPVEQGR